MHGTQATHTFSGCPRSFMSQRARSVSHYCSKSFRLQCVSTSAPSTTPKPKNQQQRKRKKSSTAQPSQRQLLEAAEQLTQKKNITRLITLSKDVDSLAKILDENQMDQIHLAAVLVRAGRMIRDERVDQFQIQQFVIDQNILQSLTKIDDSQYKLREISNAIWGLWKCQLLDIKQGEVVFTKLMNIAANVKNYDIRDVIVLLQVLGMNNHGMQDMVAMKYLVKLAHRHVADLTTSQIVTVVRVMSRYKYYQSKVFDDMLQIAGQKINDFQGREITEVAQALRACRYRDVTFLQLLANKITRDAQEENQSQNKVSLSPKDVAEILFCYATFNVKNLSFAQALFKIAKLEEEEWSLSISINCLYCLGLLGFTKLDKEIKILATRIQKETGSTRFTAQQLNYLYFAYLLFKVYFVDLQIPENVLQKARKYWLEKVNQQKALDSHLLQSILNVLQIGSFDIRQNVLSENGEILMKLVVKYENYDIVLQPLLYNCFSSNKPFTELRPSQAVRQLWLSEGKITLPIPFFEWDKEEEKMQYLQKKMNEIVPKEQQ